MFECQQVLFENKEIKMVILSFRFIWIVVECHLLKQTFVRAQKPLAHHFSQNIHIDTNEFQDNMLIMTVWMSTSLLLN